MIFCTPSTYVHNCLRARASEGLDRENLELVWNATAGVEATKHAKGGVLGDGPEDRFPVSGLS
jgi:hypothetical protein